MKKKILVNSTFMTYVVAALSCVILLLLIYHIGEVDITKPIIYEGDSISASYLMKTIDDTGWYLENQFLGGSFGGDFYDYTMSDGLSFLIVKIISVFTNNVFLIYNLFYFLTYVLATLTCLYALTQLGVKKVIAVVCALLYSFLPFHQQRMAHIWLEPYFLIPLIALVAIWIITEQIEFKRYEDSNIIQSIWKNSKLKQALLFSFLISSTGLYYAFFACCVYAIAFVINVIKRSKRQQVMFPIYFILTIIIGVILNVLPHILYLLNNGTNPVSEIVTRTAEQSEVYGLKMIQLILPRLGHRVSILNNIATSYASVSPLTNENTTAALGIIGSLGFILLMFNIFNLRSKDKLINSISLLNLGTLLIAITGGVGAIFAYLVNTPMRAYNRLSVIIAFFSLLYVGILISKLVDKYFKSSILRKMYYTGCIILLAFGIYDQTVPYTAEAQQQTIIEYESDQNFVNMIEKSVPEGSMIYQLPHVCFPSGGSYAHFKGYLNSDKLVWSFAGMQGRAQDEWEHYINTLPVEEMIRKLSLAGYAGIYIDKALYESQEKAEELIVQVLNVLDTQPVYSNNGRLLFFNMQNYNEILKSTYDEDGYKKLQNNVYNIITIDYSGEFSYMEQNNGVNTWIWCGSDGVLNIWNSSSEDINLSYSTLAVIPTGDSSISISINGEESVSYNVNKDGTELALDFILKPGANSILFHCDAPSYKSTDSRELVFYLWDTKIEY